MRSAALNHLEPFSKGACKRLLHQYVASVIERVNCGLRVREVGCGDAHEVELPPLEHLAVVVEGVLHPVLRLYPGQERRVRVGNGEDLRTGHSLVRP